ncbi:hypothetical protein [Candidatus Palauibacter soopunensis]|uniref:hypothetical protein n=1 Tax=Candidatus Palauibacter soopunensis TaxID=3056739 RepID=UPI0023849692|nr:hypothetical protein [Candidatus Palauibacter soopunensis]MDE2877340.1 hypothetical protein [Candidatus Palauibacter soopunensis]
MSRLDDEIRTWRRGLEAGGRFSQRELAELEDHLRAHAAENPESDAAPAATAALEAAAREELGDPTVLSREFAKQDNPAWRHLLLAGWGLYALSLFLSDFGTVAFEPSHPDFRMSISWQELLPLAPVSVLTLAALSTLVMMSTSLAFGRARRSVDAWVGRALGAIGGSALVLGAFNLLRPIPIPVDAELVVHGHLGPAYWAWSASFALASVALWLRGREWVSPPPKESPRESPRQSLA